MPQTMPQRSRSQEVRSLDQIGLTPAKASLASPTESDFGHGPQIWDALTSGHGSVKATAFTMGQKDESQIRRQVVRGSLTLLELFKADEQALCEVADYILATFKAARKTKKQLALERLPELLGLMIDAVAEEK